MHISIILCIQVWHCTGHAQCLHSIPAAPNTGIILWFQQFCAMFLKRIYNSFRFYGAVVSQLVLPLVFVLFGLILIVTVPSSNEDDPKRSLGLSASAISPDNVSVFYAQFGDISVGSSNFNFSVSFICILQDIPHLERKDGNNSHDQRLLYIPLTTLKEFVHGEPP